MGLTPSKRRELVQTAVGLLRDLFVFGGLGMVAYGASMLHPAAGWIVFGCGLMGIGLYWRG